MKQFWMDLLRDNFATVFETSILILMYVIGAVVLARHPDNMALIAWVTGGVALAAIVRSFTGSNAPRTKDTESTTVTVETEKDKPL